MIQVTVDASPGLHGHFLEFVLNRYIFQVPFSGDNIFDPAGAAHLILKNSVYQNTKVAGQSHDSWFDRDYDPKATHVVFVKHHTRLDFVLLTNIFYRSGPIKLINNVNDTVTFQLNKMFTHAVSDQELRMNWYSKLMERHLSEFEKKNSTQLPMLEFDYQCFFSLDQFLQELQRTADFLQHAFRFDQSLVDLWYQFMQRNQGYQAFTKVNDLFDQIVCGVEAPIDIDWKQQAYLNYKLSMVFKIFDHPDLVDSDHYPLNTKHINQIVLAHFDKI